MSDQTTKSLVPPGPSQSSKIRVSLYAGSAGNHVAEEEGIVSIWLYLAGLCATLCAVFAVSYGIEDANYGFLLYVLAVCGFFTSYILRVRRISLKNFQIPLFVCLSLIFYIGFSSGIGNSVFAPSDGMPDRTRVIQLALAWFLVLFSFVLQSDAAVLFMAVPGLTILALVSTSNTDPEIQTAFMVFICAAIFLLVHENALRTNRSLMVGSPIAAERRHFLWQLALVGVCFLGASLIANLIAAPIHQLVPNFWSNTGGESAGQRAPEFGMQNVRVEERQSLELATGNAPSSSLPLLNIQSEMPELLWRGTTFDNYTGRSFTNTVGLSYPVHALSPSNQSALSKTIIDPYDGSSHGSIFQIPWSIYEVPEHDMSHSKRVKQKVAVIGGSFSQFYGAGNIAEISTLVPNVDFNPSGGISTGVSLRAGSSYYVSSVVATKDPDILRTASKDIPSDLARLYLQKAPENGQESAQLQALAEEMTRGKTTNYDKALAIQEAIADRCKYNLQAPAAPAGRDVVEFFLFDTKQGYCDSFAAAMTMLCRYAGVPARMASGFLTGEKQSDGTYLVREKDKHVWTEVYFPHIGWVPFDATEGTVDISDHSAQTTKHKFNVLAWFTSHGIFPPLAALLILALIGYVLKVEVWDRFRKRKLAVALGSAYPLTNRAVVDAYVQAGKILAKRGLVRPVQTTPEEFLARLAQTHTPPELLGPMQTLTELHARFRYSHEVATEQDVRTAEEAIAALKSAFAGVKTRELSIAFSQTTL
ncbi:MAG TPA: transglutaminase domain-containing protein [Chthonomonadaceae bacterium]|nr:transglutaminase domain-containing protein [Chthonomonadaceae bacterium]